MHDINFIRKNPVVFDNGIKLRGVDPCAEKINKIDKEKRNTQTVLQNILAERKNLSKEVGEVKSKKRRRDSTNDSSDSDNSDNNSKSSFPI